MLCCEGGELGEGLFSACLRVWWIEPHTTLRWLTLNASTTAHVLAYRCEATLC